MFSFATFCTNLCLFLKWKTGASRTHSASLMESSINFFFFETVPYIDGRRGGTPNITIFRFWLLLLKGFTYCVETSLLFLNTKKEIFWQNVSIFYHAPLYQVLPPWWAFPSAKRCNFDTIRHIFQQGLTTSHIPVKILEFVFFVSIVVLGTTVSVKVSPSAHLLRRVACPAWRPRVATGTYVHSQESNIDKSPYVSHQSPNIVIHFIFAST